MRSSVVMTCAVCAREASGEAAFCSRCGSRLLADPAAAGTSLGSVPSQRSRRDGRERVEARPSFSRTPMPTTSSRAAQAQARAAQAQAQAQAPAGAGTVRLASLLAGFDDDVDLRDGAAVGDPWGGDQWRQDEWGEQHDDRAPSVDTAHQPSGEGDQWRGGDGEGGASRRVPIVLAAIALVLGLLVVGLLVHSLMAAPKVVVPTGASPGAPGISSGTSAVVNAPAASASPASSAGAGAAVAGATAQAPATSPDSRDSAGAPTSYAASQMLDGDPSTTWRMDGDGAGATLTFTFASPRSFASLGLINGYAKVDPDSGADRYTQERRITHVTWTVDGHSYPQALTDGDRSVQSIPVPGVSSTTVQLHIDTTTAPGQPAFDKTAISDVAFGS